MSGDNEDVHPAGGVLDDEEGMQPVQGGRLRVGQGAGQDRVRLRAREFRSTTVRLVG
jgi:hypothetical protein